MEQIKVICPKCGEIVSIDAAEEVVICEKCAKPFITEKAERVAQAEMLKLICPRCGAVNTVAADEDAAICEKCARPFVTEKAERVSEPAGVKVICPKCGEVVTVDPAEEVVICEKCSKPFITEKAERVSEDSTTVKDPKKPSSPPASPKEDFKYTADNGVEGYVGNGGDVVIPEGATYIKQYAFVKAPFTSIYVPGTVRQIGLSAFVDCKALTRVTIGYGVKEIKPAFVTNRNIEKIIFEQTEGWYISEFISNGAMGKLIEEPLDVSDPRKNAELLLDKKRHITLYLKEQ